VGLLDFFRRMSKRRAKNELFDNVRRFMADEAEQNLSCPDYLLHEMERGGAVDEWIGASGDFGRCPENPVPVNGPLGEMIYISNLSTSSGSRILGHRLGAMDRVDVYEVFALDGSRWDLIFLHPYHTRKSRLAPAGYSILAKPTGILTATNYFVETFPTNVKEAISLSAERFVGVPFVAPLQLEESRLSGFSRPPEHVRAARSLRIHSTTAFAAVSRREPGGR